MTTRMGMSMMPDFVIVGTPRPEGGVRLIASKELTRAELDVQIDTQDIFDVEYLDPVSIQVTGTRYCLTADFRRFVVIDAPDYATAFTDLFRYWTPDPEPRKRIGNQSSIESGQRAIKPGPPAIEGGRGS